MYGPQSATYKRKLWDELLNLKHSTDGIWILLGDFSAIRYDHERFNMIFFRVIAKDFNNFIASAGLQEFNHGGKKFTYLCDDGLKLSKLDHFLMCSNFIAHQALTTVLVLPCDYSDHIPLVLKPSNQDFGPPRFRFFLFLVTPGRFQ